MAKIPFLSNHDMAKPFRSYHSTNPLTSRFLHQTRLQTTFHAACPTPANAINNQKISQWLLFLCNIEPVCRCEYVQAAQSQTREVSPSHLLHPLDSHFLLLHLSASTMEY